MIGKAVAIIAIILSLVYFIPQMFKYKTSSPSPGLEPGALNITLPNQTKPWQFPDPKGFVQWIVNKFGQLSTYVGNFITKYIQGIFPNASALLGTLIFTLIIVAVLYWKSEAVSVGLRAVLIVIIGVLLLGIALSILGLI